METTLEAPRTDTATPGIDTATPIVPVKTVTRSTKFELITPDDKYKTIIGSIRLYRELCRKAFGICAMAEMAGAVISAKKEEPILNPVSDAARVILSTAFNSFKDDGSLYKSHLYQLRDFILKNETGGKASWMSFVWDSLRTDVSTAWRSKDPSIKATKGWLVLQGIRSISSFQRRGIGFPALTGSLDIHQHKLSLKWDHSIGEVEFGIKKLDGGRYHVWKGLRDGLPGWKAGTTYLSEHGGKIFVIMTYTAPARVRELEKDRVLDVVFTEDKGNFITMKGPDSFDGDFISAEEVIGILEQIKIRHDRWASRREAVGNPRRKWGSKKLWNATQNVVGRNTDHRTNVVKTRNHLWTRRIIEDAIRWNCGSLKMSDVPETMFGEPWPWSQFNDFLKYKAEEAGIILV
jgi:hypothetical protein